MCIRDSTFTDAANWGGTVPGAIDDAVIDVADADPTILFSGTHTVRSLTTNEAIQFGTGTFSVTDTADINATASLAGGTISGGTWDITNGSLTSDNTGSNRLDDVDLVGELRLLNSSSVEIYGGTTFTSARITVNSGSGTLAFEPGSTIQGDITVEGSGTGSAFVGVDGSGTLTVAPGVTVANTLDSSVQMFLGDSNDHIINQGTVLGRSTDKALILRGQFLSLIHI